MADVLGAHRCDGTGEVALLDGTVTDYDKVVERGGLVLEGHVDDCLARSVNRLRLHTDVRELQLVAAGSLDGVVSVEVGHRDVLRPLFLHRGADDGLAVGVLDGTLDCLRRYAAHD